MLREGAYQAREPAKVLQSTAEVRQLATLLTRPFISSFSLEPWLAISDTLLSQTKIHVIYVLTIKFQPFLYACSMDYRPKWSG